MSAPSLLERFEGCLLGQAVGDGLGSPFEDWSANQIALTVGSFRKLVYEPRPETLEYTDDTQMAIGVAQTLAEASQIHLPTLCRHFAANFDPRRRYGRNARRILEAMAAGEDWQAVRDALPPSFGNGGAMRAAPIGLFFRHDPDRAAEEARLACFPTHRHPLCIEGAQLLAVAAALASADAPFDRDAFYGELGRFAHADEYRRKLDLAATLTARDALDALGNGIVAPESVVTAIACFTVAPGSFRETAWRALSLGGDVDTLAAMACALSGAHLGRQGVPFELVAFLEDGTQGRTYHLNLAARLHDAHVRLRRPAAS